MAGKHQPFLFVRLVGLENFLLIDELLFDRLGVMHAI